MGNGKKKSGAESRELRRKERGRTCKRRGEAVEAAFLAKAASLGFRVAKPWGESDRYDFVVEGERGFWRMQVKHTTCRRTAYRLSLVMNADLTQEHELIFSWSILCPTPVVHPSN